VVKVCGLAIQYIRASAMFAYPPTMCSKPPATGSDCAIAPRSAWPRTDLKLRDLRITPILSNMNITLGRMDSLNSWLEMGLMFLRYVLDPMNGAADISAIQGSYR
jgi:hypothetical protein